MNTRIKSLLYDFGIRPSAWRPKIGDTWRITNGKTSITVDIRNSYWEMYMGRKMECLFHGSDDATTIDLPEGLFVRTNAILLHRRA